MSLLTQERIEDALPPKGPGFGAMAQRNTEQITDNSHFFQNHFLLLVLKAVNRLTIVNAKQSANSLVKWCPAATAEAYKTSTLQ